MDKKSYSFFMQITPAQLLYLRKERKMTREELAKELNCSASAIVHWEGGAREIPTWVAEKMFATLPVEFTVEELSELFTMCREFDCTFGELIQDAVRFRIEERRLKKNPFAIKAIIGPGEMPNQTESSLIDNSATELVEKEACATPATSKDTSPGSSPPAAATANIVPLPKPPMMRTAAPPPPALVAEETPEQEKPKKRPGKA